MNAPNIIETRGRLVNATRLDLESPLTLTQQVPLRVLLFVEANEDDEKKTSKPDFFAAIGSAYREHPNMPRQTTAEVMRELREGDED